MAYLRSLRIDGDTSEVKEYKAGNGISITPDGTISATGGGGGGASYSAGSGIQIGNDNTISAEMNPSNTYTKEEVDTKLSSKQNRLSAGEGIDISDNVISATGGSSGSDTALFVDKGGYVSVDYSKVKKEV